MAIRHLLPLNMNKAALAFAGTKSSIFHAIIEYKKSNKLVLGIALLNTCSRLPGHLIKPEVNKQELGLAIRLY